MPTDHHDTSPRIFRPSAATSHRAIAWAAFGAGAVMATAPAMAQAPVQMPEVSVTAPLPPSPAETYKLDNSVSPKFTAPLLDTPKSVTVITQELIEERGATSLIDVLRTTPGITMASGEGGTPVGDRPFIRGFESSTDIMIDGIRDLGRFPHEAFNLESIEITKGPGSAYTGRGATGGSINLISKTPQARNSAAGSVTIGTDLTKRVTADGNYLINDSIAVRMNVMGQHGEVAGRDHLKTERWGVAPSVTFGINGPTRATFAYYHLTVKDTPDLGHPFDPATGRPAKVDRNNFYGFTGRDYRNNKADVGTVTLEHDFSNDLRIRNVTRYGWSNNEYIMTRPSIDPASGMVNRDGRSRNSDYTAFVNQTDLSGEFETFGIRHSFATGVEITREQIRNRAYSTPASPRTDLHNPSPKDPFGGPITISSSPSNPTKTNVNAAYIFDTIHLTEQFDVNLGLRFDDYEVKSGSARHDSSFWNYQAGLVYKPVPHGSIYVAFGTSSNPSGETEGQSGGADGASGGGLGGNRVNLDPERSKSYELGTKWDLFDRKLAVSAAVFRTEKTNQRAEDPVTGEVELIGNSRVDGFELGVSGNVTDRWKVWGGYTYLNAKLRDDGAGENDGKKLKYIAPHNFSIWTTYDILRDVTIGGGAYYMSSRPMNDANTLKLPSYWRFDAMASYRVNENFDLRLNFLNLTDETIYDGSHVGLFANVAPGRSVLLTANVRF